jgi:hypothetical protein
VAWCCSGSGKRLVNLRFAMCGDGEERFNVTRIRLLYMPYLICTAIATLTR